MAARGGPGPGSRHRSLCGLLLLCLWLPGGRPGEPAAPSSGVDRLLQDFRRQLQRHGLARSWNRSCWAPAGGLPGCGRYGGLPGGARHHHPPAGLHRGVSQLPARARDRARLAAVRGGLLLRAELLGGGGAAAPGAQRARTHARVPLLLFNCTARGRSVCKFAPLHGFRTYTLSRAGDAAGFSAGPGEDEPPVSRAGKDVVLQLPTDGVVLDGRESTDDHAIILYEWTLQQGDLSSVDMKVPQPGTLRLSRLKEGASVFQLTVTDSVGQRSSDNVSVTVLPRLYSTGDEDSNSSGKNQEEGNYFLKSKSGKARAEHPALEAGQCEPCRHYRIDPSTTGAQD